MVYRVTDEGREDDLLDAINLRQRLALTEDQQVIPITNVLDAFGDETDNLDEAVAFVCGPTAEGHWISDDIATYDFNRAAVN